MKRRGGMVIAIASGHYVDEFGQRQEVIAGQSAWDRSELLETLTKLGDPGLARLFGLKLDGQASVANTPADACRQARDVELFTRKAPPWIPERLDVEPRLEVILRPYAKSDIADEIMRQAPLIGRERYLDETGGFLLGSLDLRAADVKCATGPGPDAGRSRGSLRFDLSEIQRARDDRARDGMNDAHVGDWHLHAVGGGRPSERDLIGWLAFRDLYKCSRYVGVIATPDSVYGWAEPHFSGWAVRREVPSRLPVYEPARVVT